MALNEYHPNIFLWRNKKNNNTSWLKKKKKKKKNLSEAMLLENGHDQALEQNRNRTKFLYKT